MLKFKLVTWDCKTRVGCTNETDWRIGQRVEATGDPNQGLCSNGWLHCHDTPELAVMLNPIHANIQNPRMMVVKVEGEGRIDKGLKSGYRVMTPVLFMDCPEITTVQHVRFAILCALEVWQAKNFVSWAKNWLTGKDRSNATATAVGICNAEAANAAAYAAHAAVYAANDAAIANAVAICNAEAANAAAYAAYAAAYAANDAAIANANAAVNATYAVYWAAYDATCDLDFVGLAQQAIDE